MVSVLSLVKNDDHRMLCVLLKVPQSLLPKDLQQGLLHASKHGLLECAACLINAGVDVECEDACGNQPLHHSVGGNHCHLTLILLEAGASPNRKGSSRNFPMHIAARGNMVECLSYLINHKACIDAKDSAGQTPLIVATKDRRFGAIKLLIENGCGLDYQDYNGRTALHYASQLGTAVDILLEAGANPNICDNSGCTPLLLAATEGFSHVVKLLCSFNCNPNIANHFVNKTPIHILAFKGHADCISDLLWAGADVNMLDNEQHTPLWYAVDNSRLDVVKLLLKANSHVDTYRCGSAIPSEACPVRLALVRQNVHILKMFIIVGFDTTHMRQSLKQGYVSKEVACELSHWMDHAGCVMTLKQICRRWILHHSGIRLMHDVSTLPIPSGLRDYVLLKELDDVHV